MDQTALIAAIAAFFGSTGFWAWLVASRRMTTTEYQALVKDLQKERALTTKEINRLESIIDRQDGDIHNLRLDITDQELHIVRLEQEIVKLGGTPPQRPVRSRRDSILIEGKVEHDRKENPN